MSKKNQDIVKELVINTQGEKVTYSGNIGAKDALNIWADLTSNLFYNSELACYNELEDGLIEIIHLIKAETEKERKDKQG